MSALLITTGVLYLLISWSLTVCLIYYGHKFYKLRNEMIVIKRRGNIVTIYTLSGIIILLFGYPLTIILYWGWNLITYKQYPLLFLILDIMNDLVFTPFYFSLILLSVLRGWLVYYDIQFSNACLNKQWKQLLNNSKESMVKENWYIEHHDTLGNGAFMMKIMLIMIFILASISMSTSFMYSLQYTTLKLYFFINISVWILSVITVAIIFKKMPFFNDNIYLYQEFKIMSYGGFVALFIYMLSFIISSIPWITETVGCVHYLNGMLIAFIIPFLSTFWVLKRIKLFNTMNMMNTGNQTVSLQDILEDNDLIHLFMQHLIAEFSMESLLSFIEFTQYKYYMIQQLNMDKTNINISIDIKFPNGVPLSDIVYNSNNTDKLTVKSFKIMAFKLYNKYIKNGTEFEINISYADRQRLSQLINDYNQWISKENNINQIDLVQLFDNAALEMRKMLNHSKIRFKYQKL